MSNRTLYGFTQTREGLIAHKAHENGFHMPVMIKKRIKGQENTSPLPEPEKIDGCLVYALPGGGVFIDNLVK